MPPQRIFLVGLPGSGKSSLGRLAAARLGWQFLDTDAMVEAAAGSTIPQIFSGEGEARFRALEAEALARAATHERAVIATGGGALATSAGRAAIASGLTAFLDVSPAEALRRLQAEASTPPRPLLEGDPLARLEALADARRPAYERADVTISVDGRTPEELADTIRRLWESERGRALHPSRLEPRVEPAAVVRTATASYPVIVQEGALERLGASCRAAGLGGRAFLITDDVIAPLFSAAAVASLEGAGYRVYAAAIPAGEEHKTLATVEGLYHWLLGERVERSDFVVCLGGGVVTDLGGFAAATCLRGIAFVHVPTTLLAMVDASIGGKTGVDHPLGKNMVGAFAQPAAVVIDPLLLKTLPERQLRAGWAEIIKHGLIFDEGLVRELEVAGGQAVALMSPALIARSVAIKADVVSEDERETGRRTLLNYGHTIGHAIETVTGYSAYLHGEAVAIGMRAAALISVEMGLLSPATLARQQALLRACGLPEAAPGVAAEDVIQATLSDKKVRDGAIRWVLLEDIGRAVTREDVPVEAIRRALAAVLG